MTILQNPGSKIYPNKFAVGDKVESLQRIRFIDGTVHKKGQIIEVTENTVAYYNVNSDKYRKI